MENNQIVDIEKQITQLAVKNASLFSVTIELLTKCNWRCKHCYIPSYDNNGLPKEIIFNVFEQLRKLGVFEITLTGGEIFCRDDIMEIIKKAREMCFNVYLYSNISLLDEKKITELSKLSVSLACTIFSLVESTNDEITGVVGSLKKVMENMMLIKKHNIPLEVKAGVTSSNHKDYRQIKEFCDKNRFAFTPYFDINSKSNGDQDPHLFRVSSSQLEEIITDLDKITGFSTMKHSNNEYMCDTLRTQLFINSYGDIFPCFRFYYKLGNIKESSLEQIWYESEVLSGFRNIKWGDLKECIDCEKEKFCRRCPGIAYLEDKNLMGKSSLACSIADTRFKSYTCNNLI